MLKSIVFRISAFSCMRQSENFPCSFLPWCHFIMDDPWKKKYIMLITIGYQISWEKVHT
jgi:hypothetical protein